MRVKLQKTDLKIALLLGIPILGSLFLADTIPLYGLIIVFSITWTIRYPEFAVAIFLTDSVLFFAYFNYLDLTLVSVSVVNTILLGSALAVLYFKNLQKEPKPLFPLIIVLGIGLLLFFQASYSPSRTYGLLKSFLYFYYNVTFFILPFYFFASKKSLDTIYKQGVTAGILIFIICVLLLIDNGIPERFDPSGTLSSIWFGREAGLLSFFFLYQYLTAESVVSKLVSFVLIAVSILFLNLAGSRGPVVAYVITAFIYLVIIYRGALYKKIIAVIVFTFTVAGATLVMLPKIISRFQNLSDDPSSLLRIYSAIKAAKLIWVNPFLGTGTGSFKDLVNEVIKYPHNIFLELGMENGLLVMGLFIAFCIYIFTRLFHLRKENNTGPYKYLYDISMLIFLFGFLNAQFSGDIAHNPLLWFAAGTITVKPKKLELNET